MGVLHSTHQYAQHHEFIRMDDLATRQLDLYVAALDGELQRYAYLAGLLEVGPTITNRLRALDTAAPAEQPLLQQDLSHTLENLSVRAGIKEWQLTTHQGVVVASSHADHSPLGTPFSKHPNPAQWLDSLKNGLNTQWFMAHPEDHSGEYYFSHPLFDAHNPSQALGASIVTISLAPMEATWIDMSFRPDSEKILVLDAQDRIILSSVSPWKNRILRWDGATPQASASPSANPETLALQQVGRHFKLRHLFGRSATAPHLHRDATDAPYLVHQRPHPQTGWRVLILSNPEGVWHNIRITLLSTLAALSFLHLLYCYFLLRRKAMHKLLKARNQLQKAHDQLECKVTERTLALQESNEQLQNEMHERQHAQAQLLHNSKMAALGQMSAKVAHEISQPLTALRALSNNSRILLDKNRLADVQENMGLIAGIADRMIHITQQLRNFSQRRQTARTNHHQAPVDINQAIAHARMLLADRLASQGVEIASPKENIFIMGDSIPIEQVFTNLFANALDAMQYHPTDTAHSITVQWQAIPTQPDRVEITVQDTGPGIDPSEAQHLFEPFFTHKPDGKGLGLGLSIAATIIAEHGGTMAVRENPKAGCGAMFVFDLPRA